MIGSDLKGALTHCATQHDRRATGVPVVHFQTNRDLRMSDCGSEADIAATQECLRFWGRSAVTSQRLRRVALQFIALCLVMAALYLSVR